MKKGTDKQVRQAQLISPWGVGAIVPFPDDETLMIAGIDYWKYGENKEQFKIEDPRLQKRLGVRKLRLPPDFRTRNEDSTNYNLKIGSVRFPLWHFCPLCKKMKRILPNQLKQEKCDNHKDIKLAPERFIVICEDGHIDDFPIKEWVHSDSDASCDDDKAEIRRVSYGRSAALSSIKYECSCGASKSMAGAFNENSLDKIGIKCQGKMPWLGEDYAEECGKSLKVVQRGASNVWFPHIVSSIKIPSSEDKILKKYLDKYEQPASVLVDGEINRELLRTLYDAENELRSYTSFEQFLRAMEKRVFGDADSEDDSKSHEEIENDYRKTEYQIIQDNFGNPSDELYCVKKSIDSYSENVRRYITNITAVKKLTATRAFIGFSRLSPDFEKSYYEQKRMLSKQRLDWVPAVKTEGEGIFIQFDEKQIAEWSGQEIVAERISMLNNRMKNSMFMKNIEGNLRPEFVMLHTFAHLFINQLTYECGYSTAAIRERIYCERAGDTGEMYGILIYTASGDSEGSLGGLVKQAEPEFFEKIVDKAIENARWCSTDPVCIESKGQGTDSLNLAACHNCSLLPETSCEFSNRLLDRALVIGTLNEKDLGFFN